MRDTTHPDAEYFSIDNQTSVIPSSCLRFSIEIEVFLLFSSRKPVSVLDVAIARRTNERTARGA